MKLVIISDSLRRDFQDPLKYFERFEITHLYRTANYGDMKKEDFKGTVKVSGFLSILAHLNHIRPNIIAAPEPYQGWSRFTKISTKMLRLWLAAVIYKIRHPNTVLFFHSLENIPDYQRFGWTTLIARSLMYWYASHCDFVIYLNQGAKENLVRAGVGQTKLVHLLWGNWGVDVGEFHPQNSKFKIQNSKFPVILFVGRVDYLKGINYLVEAFERLKKDFSHAELWVAGDGPLKSRYQNLKGVKLLGVIKNQDLPRLFLQAWITSVPAITTNIWAEQVGMVNLQSLACGTPVVSTKSGAIPEFVNREAAFLVPEKDRGALYEALVSMIKNKDLRSKMGRAGRNLVLKKYDARKNIKKIETFLLSHTAKS